jgi:hypothetical protein
VANVSPVPSLTEVLRKYAEQGPHGLMVAVDEVTQNGLITEYIHNLLSHHPGCADDMPLAYRHPNGFTKIRLMTRKECEWAVRLHVWAEGASDYDIHSHRWDFASRIVAGSLTEETYDLTSESGEHAKYRCAPSIEGRYDLKFENSCGVHLASRNMYTQGASYERDATTLHMAYAQPSSRAVSVFIQGQERVAFTTVIRRTRSDLDRNAKAPRCTASELTELLQEAVGLIDSE